MPKLVFSEQELKAYFNGEIMSIHAAEARLHEAAIRVHAEGGYPQEIIEERRPHEALAVQEYRQKIWKPITKPIFNKVFNSLSKIRRSADWGFQYSDEPFNRIPEEETIKEYCEKKFPYFTSVTNWAFSILLRNYLIDPNAVMVIQPLEEVFDATDFVEPYPNIYNSSDVIDFKEKDFAVIENPLGSAFYSQEGRPFEAQSSFWIITTERVMRYDQITGKKSFTKTVDILHELGFMPAYRLGGVLVEAFEGDFLYESRIAGMLTGFDEAVREYSDLQASKVMHIYPERWEISQTECPDCAGIGYIQMADNVRNPCGTCHGTAFITPEGPYSKIVIGRGNLDVNTHMPTPPAGYVEKDVKIVELQQAGVKEHLRDALASINMEHLHDVPLSNSGIAKEVDRDETNNFVHSVAEDLVRIIDWTVYCSACWRYKVQYSPEQIAEMVPTIPVPEHFDIFSTKFVEEEVKVAKENKLNPTIISAIEKSYASKKFAADPKVREVLMLVLDLDPLPNITDEEKVMRLSNSGVKQIDYIISSNIQGFIQRAMEEDENFATLEFAEQKLVLETFAEEVQEATNTENEKSMQDAIDLQVNASANATKPPVDAAAA